MTFKHTGLYAAMLAATMGLAACSSGSGTTSDANVTGRITAFGSVIIDGVEYETNNCITSDGVTIAETDLSIGMIVTVTGTSSGSTGNASCIEYNDDLEGIVQSNDGTTVVVMGYNVTFDSSTNFEGFTDIAELIAGSVVEVSGFSAGNGATLATMIELKNTSYTEGDEIEVKGVISNLDNPAAGSFTIGAMTVDYSGITPAFTLADGQYVEVKSITAPVAGVMIANEIELESNEHDGNEGEGLEFEGLITAIAADGSSITIGDEVIALPAGFDVSGFSVGDLVDIDVTVVGGELVIDGIETDDHGEDHPGQIEIQATLDASSIGTNTVTLMGITFVIDITQAFMVDHSETSEHYFNMSDLTAGDRIEIEGYPNPDGSDTYLATSVERKLSSTDTHYTMEGNVTIGADPASVTVAGITLDFTGLVVAPTLVNGNEIQVTGSFNAGVFTVTEYSLED